MSGRKDGGMNTAKNGAEQAKVRMTRREFFRECLRYAAAGGLVAAAGALVRREGGKRDRACTGGGVCWTCAAFEGCELPQALLARDADAARRG